jgi:UMF1 family MFS transporter
MSILKKGDKKLIQGWAMYDWANSVYSLTIATAIFPIYFKTVTSNDHGNTIILFGREYVNTALYSYALSFAFMVVALISPLLSSIADFKRNKMIFMQMFCYLGSASCAALYFFDANNIALGLCAFVLATIGFTGSIVFYNAYLPEIVDEEGQDKTSARGFAMGYIGSVILLIANLVLIMMHDSFGLDASLASKISFITVGLWWAGFAQITFRALRNFEKGKPNYGISKSGTSTLFGGYTELKIVLSEIRKLPNLRNFLLAFFFYNMAVQTVMYIASLFGSKELKMETSHLIITVLVIQLVAIGGAYLFSFISKKLGNINALLIAIIFWIIICIGAYLVQTEVQFIALAFAVGSVMGGIQALSRSTYSKMLPETEDHASYFSFFDVTEKIAIVFGTITYGLIEELTGSMRNSVLALIIFFVIGLLILQTLRKKVLK